MMASANLQAAPPVPLKTPEGFAVPQPGHVFSFSRDYGSHPEFRIEWWYVTGHLFADDGHRFGFQATFFRQSAPDHNAQVYLAHIAVLDVATQKFIAQERLNLSGWDAAAAEGRLEVFNGNWSLRQDTSDAAANLPSLLLMGGVRAEAAFRLRLRPIQPLVSFGENSVSRKGTAPTAASYYLTFPRLAAQGELEMGGKIMPVHGEAWMDHEISSSQLDAGLVGWDWVGLQFSDGRQIMLYRLRKADGSADPASALTWVERGGITQRSSFTWTVTATWKSPATGAVYPSRVEIGTTDPATAAPVRLTLEPLAADQELSGRLGGMPYWEGACRVRDASGHEVGSAYLELTGYAGPLKL